MRRISVVVLFMALCACSPAGSDAGSEVPDVVGERLDLAAAHIEDAGLEYEEIGGGTFGVIDTSAWTVCDQKPEPGTMTDQPVRLIVDRSCGSSDVTDDEADTAESDSDGGGNDRPSGGRGRGRARFRAEVVDVVPVSSNAVLVSWVVRNVGSGAGAALCRIKIETDDEGIFNNDAAQYVDVPRIAAGKARTGSTRVTGLSADYVVESSMFCA
jgi:hypothetical protein